MKKYLTNPKTLLGILVILTALVLWALTKIDTGNFLAVLGLVGGWIAFTRPRKSKTDVQ